MRVLVKNLAVFECARLGLVRVANEVNRFAALAVHERPLEAAGEPGATPAAQAGLEHFIADLFLRRHLPALGQLFRLQREGLLEHLVSAIAQIAVEVGRITRLIGVLEDEAVFAGHLRFAIYKSVRPR